MGKTILIFLGFLTIGLPVVTSGQEIIRADLTRLNAPEIDQEIERIEARRAGGRETRRYKALTTKGLSYEAGTTLKLAVDKLPASIEWAPGLVNLPADWTDFAGLELSVKSNTACTLRLSAVQVSGFLGVTAMLKPDRATIVELPLRDLPLAAADAEPYRPMSIRLEIMGAAGEGTALEISDLQLTPAGDDYDRRVVDRYGQRMSTSWPGKVRRDRDLKRDLRREKLPTGPSGRSRFGGWADGPRVEATGFFRVLQDDGGTWWLIDPDGYRFWSAGITCVNPYSDWTRTEDRSFLYEWLPEPGVENGRSEDDRVNFLRANIARKYDSLEQWRDHTLDRMISWGHNTIGNWSDPAMLRPGRVAYTRNLGTRTQEAPMATRRFADLFDPAWQAWFDQYLAREVAPHRDDPWLLGWFVDNELPWLHMGLLDAEAASALKKEWTRFVRQRVVELDSAAAIWDRSFSVWSDLSELTEEDCPAGTAAGELREAFEAYYAEVYFKTVSEALNKHDPNHLYLGCRFVRRAPARAIVETAGRYTDVMTVNCYAWEPAEEQFGEWHEVSGRPILIGEHHVTLASDRQAPPPWQVFNAQEREAYYRNFVQVWAQRSYSLGCHYFQLIDQPLTGRGDGENRTIGWLDITDQPYEDLVRAARAVLPRIYEWHGDGGNEGKNGNGKAAGY